VIREAAEYPNSFVPLGPGEERVETPRFTLCMTDGAQANTVQRQRFGPDEVDEVLSEVRSLLRARSRPQAQWEIGSAAQPAGLVELLLARGLVRACEPIAVAVALRSPPPAAPAAGLVTRRVRTLEEYVSANEVQFEAFSVPAADLDEQRAIVIARWNVAPRTMHAVWLDGELVGAGTCSPTPAGLALFGGATLRAARGRGVYRALIGARWRESVELGIEALITQAGAMSQPILARLGFEPVGTVDMLVDDFGPD
jgi:hypothetical protein